MNRLPSNAREKAGSYSGPVGPARQEEIISHCEAAPAAVAQIIKNGGPEADFLRYLAGDAAPKDAPENKRGKVPSAK